MVFNTLPCSECPARYWKSLKLFHKAGRDRCWTFRAENEGHGCKVRYRSWKPQLRHRWPLLEQHTILEALMNCVLCHSPERWLENLIWWEGEVLHLRDRIVFELVAGLLQLVIVHWEKARSWLLTTYGELAYSLVLRGWMRECNKNTYF